MNNITDNDVRKFLQEIIDSDFCKKDEYKCLCAIKALENTDFLEQARNTISKLKNSSREKYLDEKIDKRESQNDYERGKRDMLGFLIRMRTDRKLRLNIFKQVLPWDLKRIESLTVSNILMRCTIFEIEEAFQSYMKDKQKKGGD